MRLRSPTLLLLGFPLALATGAHAPPCAPEAVRSAITCASATPRSGPEEEVLAVVQRLFDAMRAKDTATMLRLFDRDARLVGMRPGREGPVVQRLTAAEFAAFVARDTRAPWIERAWSPEVRISGTLATVWAEYDFHFGDTFSHCGVDAVQLLLTPDGWKIMSIADTFVREGCARRAPPGEGETPAG